MDALASSTSTRASTPGAVSPVHAHPLEFVESAEDFFLVPSQGEKVSVKLEFARPEDKVNWRTIFDSPIFVDWAARFASSSHGLRLRTLRVLSVEFQTTEEKQTVASLSIDAEVVDATGETVKPSILTLRGPTTALVVLLRNVDTQKDLCLFTMRPRIAVGTSDYIEIPDCNLDESGKFVGPIVDMIEERCDIKLTRNSTVCLTGLTFGAHGAGIYNSPASEDDRVQVYLYRDNISAEDLQKLEQRLGGVKEEEKKEDEEQSSTAAMKRAEGGIRLKLVTMGDAWRSTLDAKSIVALFLVHELRYHFKMPKYKPPPNAKGLRNRGIRTGPVEKTTASFTKVGQLMPDGCGVNVRGKLVKVVNKDEEVEVTQRGLKLRALSVSVGDETGTVCLRLLDDQIETFEALSADAPVVIRNAKIDMDDGHIKLVVDKWGKLSAEADDEKEFEFLVKDDMDMSATEYELVKMNAEENKRPRGTSGRGGRKGRARPRGGRRGGTPDKGTDTPSPPAVDAQEVA